VNQQCYAIAWQLFTSVVRLTPSPKNPGPFASGLLVNQWYPSVDRPSQQKGDATSPDGAASIERINAFTQNGRAFLGKDGKVYLTNNVEHAYRAEMLGWPEPEWSGKIGPYRMVARSLQAVSAKNKRVQI
jgi:hypothetical protein